MRVLTLLSCALLLLAGCESVSNSNDSVSGAAPSAPSSSSSSSSTKVTKPSTDEKYDEMLATIDLTTVTSAGIMNGTWKLVRDGKKVATLKIRDDAAAPHLTGVFRMADGSFGRLHPSSRDRDGHVEAHWLINDHSGWPYEYGIADAAVQPDGSIAVRYATQRDGRISDAKLVRVD